MKQVLARVLEAKPPADPLPSSMKPKDIKSKVDAYLATLGNATRAAKIRKVFKAYTNGATLDQVQELTGASRGTTSNYLNQLERETGACIVRGKQRAVKSDDLQKERENGQRRVTGHRTASVVLKHYFRPGREDFRAVLAQAMPKMLGHGETRSTKEQMKELLQRMTVRTWSADRKRLLELIEAL